MTYEIIDTDHDSAPLSVPPVQVWIISSLEISIRQDGATHLLLTFPSYPLSAQRSKVTHDEGYWSIPFVAYPVPIAYSPPTTVGSLRKLAASRASEDLLLTDLSHLAYQMGLQDTNFEYRGEFFELKNSPRSPELTKAFKIVRYGLSSVSETSIRNLADPDLHRGYVYLPVEEFETFTRPVYSEAHKRVERWYLGKPLMSDIEYVLSNRQARGHLIMSSIPVGRTMFSRCDSGILCAVDLAGYGAALKYARQNMRSFSEGSETIQANFRKSIAAHFELMLAKLGVMQAQTAGDGFIATFPERVFLDIKKTIIEILREWLKVLEKVEKLNNSIDDPGFKVGSRMALHFGQYEYGRIGGVRSFAAAFDGTAIIDVARLEQGMAAATRSGAQAAGMPSSASLSRQSNYVILSKELSRLLGDGWNPQIEGIRFVGELTLTSKEFKESGDVWEVDHAVSGSTGDEDSGRSPSDETS